MNARRTGTRAGARTVGRAAVLAGAAIAAYALALRPWYRRWGATAAEATGPLPGDDLARYTPGGSTRAITIAAPIEDVWPWLVQIGYGRGGFYSYDGLENLFVRCFGGTPGYRSVETVLPEHQSLRVGDFIPSAPPDLLDGCLADEAGWRVLALEPPRLLVLAGWGAFVLDRRGERRDTPHRPERRCWRVGPNRALPLLGARALRDGAPHAARDQGPGRVAGPHAPPGGGGPVTGAATHPRPARMPPRATCWSAHQCLRDSRPR